MNRGLNQLDGVLKTLHRGCVNTIWTQTSAHTPKLSFYEEMNTSSRFSITLRSSSNNFENKRIFLYKTHFLLISFWVYKLLSNLSKFFATNRRSASWKLLKANRWFSQLTIKLAKSSKQNQRVKFKCFKLWYIRFLWGIFSGYGKFADEVKASNEH